MILRARTILPVSSPPIENGAVVISRDRIQAAGAWRDIKAHSNGEVVDLGEMTVMPGLINAHCHLDYTDMAGQLPPPPSFIDWIPLIIAAKSAWGYSEYARSWLNGARMLLRTGTTTVGDVEAVPELLPDVWDATPLRVFSFLEMTGIRARREPRLILLEAVNKIDSLSHSRCCTMLSPHAPYSTLPELLRLTAEHARKKKRRVMIHLSESEMEFEMFARAQGRMYDWLKRNERDNSDCGLGSPVAHLARNDMLGENLLAIHVNLLAPGDADLLARNHVHVVHCPCSHDYFRHPAFPIRKLPGVNICLGTDSLATIRPDKNDRVELNLFTEMQMFSDKNKSISSKEIIRMATVNGAKALGWGGKIGELSPNALADLIAIPFTGKKADIYDTVLHHEGDVSASMIGGQWAVAP
jgi:cytosine/adenosine deaminase-related metal-dependent hydrolase